MDLFEAVRPQPLIFLSLELSEDQKIRKAVQNLSPSFHTGVPLEIPPVPDQNLIAQFRILMLEFGIQIDTLSPAARHFSRKLI